MVGFKCIGQGCKMRRWRLNKGNGGTVQGLSLKRVQMLSSKKVQMRSWKTLGAGDKLKNKVKVENCRCVGIRCIGQGCKMRWWRLND